MVAVSLALDYDRAWTPEDVALVPEFEGRRVEIVDGMLVVSPLPSKPHLFIADRIVFLLFAAAPPTAHATGSSAQVEVSRSYRVPDVAVVTRSALTSPGSTFRPSEVLLAVEVESPSSITTDRIIKPAQYASAGIAHYWRVETDPLRLITYALAGDVYVETGAWGAAETATITDPFAVTIEMATLLP